MKLNLLGDVAELTRQLVDIQSVSGNEAEIADAIEQALKPLTHLSLTRDGNSIVAKTSLGRSQQVVIAGHIDTVPVADNLPSKLMSFEREQVIPVDDHIFGIRIIGTIGKRRVFFQNTRFNIGNIILRMILADPCKFQFLFVVICHNFISP